MGDTAKPQAKWTEHRFGAKWGGLNIVRVADCDGYVVLRLEGKGWDIHLTVTPAGRKCKARVSGNVTLKVDK